MIHYLSKWFKLAFYTNDFRHGRIHFLAGIISITFGLYVLLKQPIPRNVQDRDLQYFLIRRGSAEFLIQVVIEIFMIPFFKFIISTSNVHIPKKHRPLIELSSLTLCAQNIFQPSLASIKTYKQFKLYQRLRFQEVGELQ